MGDGGRTQNSPAAARQAARHQRRNANQAANLADRSKDRDQDRANRQAEREERRAAKAERKAARKAKREAAKAAEDRTTLGEAVAEEAQRRWDKRRAAEKDKAASDDKAKDSASDKDSEATTKKTPKDGPETAADGPQDGSATKEPDDGKKSGEKPSDGSKKQRRFRRRRTGAGRAGRRGRARRASRAGRAGRRGRQKDSPFGAEDSTPTVEWPGRPTRPPRTGGKGENDIVDADIVPDQPAAVTTGVRGLPPAPEPHTERPGTTRPTAQEDSVTSPVRKASSGQVGLAAKHRTDITFDEYLVAMTNIAFNAGADMKRAQELAVALRKVAVALRSMATDLVNDHNIDTEVTELVADIADAAELMQRQAQRTADQCGEAFQAARLVAAAVGRTYGEDIQAMDDAGLAHASAAAHHD
ncbi:putative ATP/GTP-binding Gly/Ala-rich protein (plasmid) [Streptomyces hygroscopicus subsp. jinggangensis 5008]|nr:putative ATP/GTP-binding Gly/Ala-rich protein [Streptomyces hygroscopicus subsp. jinggangensis 5008]AGF68370.1 putative ATP/GTP-binding Gly/Ala-rich protein [Streptomyces hygroscopicus subsp. jinggangensis TL01]